MVHQFHRTGHQERLKDTVTDMAAAVHTHWLADHGQPTSPAHPRGKIPIGRETGRRITATAPEHVAADKRRSVSGKPVEDACPCPPGSLDERKHRALQGRNRTAEGWKKAA